MLRVSIYANSTFISEEIAVRIKGDAKPDSINTYLLDSNGKKIKHRYGDGAAKLAQKMMKNLQKQGV